MEKKRVKVFSTPTHDACPEGAWENLVWFCIYLVKFITKPFGSKFFFENTYNFNFFFLFVTWKLK